MCKALISPAKRDRAAASAAAPSDSKITIAGVLAASCAVNTIPAGVASSRASSQNSPTFGGSAASSGVTGTYAERASDAPSKTRSAASGSATLDPVMGNRVPMADPVAGPVAQRATSLSISQPPSDEADHSVRGTESLFGPLQRT